MEYVRESEHHFLNDRLLKEHGVSGLRAKVEVFGMRIIMTAEPEDAKLVFTKNLPKSGFYAKIRNLWGENGLGAVDHGPWKRLRALVQPAFRPTAIRMLWKRFEEHSKDFVAHLEANVDKTVSFHYDVMKNSLKTIIKIAFGYTIDESASTETFLDALKAVVSGVASPIIFLPHGGKIVKHMLRKQVKIVDDVIYGAISAKRAFWRANTGLVDSLDVFEEKAGRVLDFLDLLVMQEILNDEDALSDSEIRDSAFNFLVGGHETTASALAWLAFELARHPECEARMVQELKTVDELRFDDLNSLKYTQQALNETLRMYPAATRVARMVTEETLGFALADGTVVPKDAYVEVELYSLHRNPKYWDNPDVFNPANFDKEKCEARHPHAWIPFTAGPRTCIGKQLFYTQAKVFLHSVYSKFTFELDATKESGVEKSSTGLLQPNAVYLIVKRRQ